MCFISWISNIPDDWWNNVHYNYSLQPAFRGAIIAKTATKAKTTTRSDRLQPAGVQKPRADFPLMPHRASGQWCKKINGHIRYFGLLDNPDAAEKWYPVERAMI